MEVKRDFIFDPSLALYLPLYELDGAFFMSKDAHGHLCTVTGALWRQNGRYFDGDDKISCGNSPAFDLTTELTFMAWAKWTGETGRPRILIKQFGNSAVPYAWEFVPADNTLMVSFYDAPSEPSVKSTATVVGNIWEFVAVTFSKPTIHFYIDGVDDGAKTFNHTLPVNTANLHIANYSSDYFIGTYGEIWIYNRALSPQEIQHNYLATKWRYR